MRCCMPFAQPSLVDWSSNPSRWPKKRDARWWGWGWGWGIDRRGVHTDPINTASIDAAWSEASTVPSAPTLAETKAKSGGSRADVDARGSIGIVPPALAAGTAAAFLAFLAGFAAGVAAAAAGLRLAGAFFFEAALPPPPPPQALVKAASSQTSMSFLVAAAPLAPAPGPATRRSAWHGEGRGTGSEGRKDQRRVVIIFGGGGRRFWAFSPAHMSNVPTHGDQRTGIGTVPGHGGTGGLLRHSVRTPEGLQQ